MKKLKILKTLYFHDQKKLTFLLSSLQTVSILDEKVKIFIFKCGRKIKTRFKILI